MATAQVPIEEHVIREDHKRDTALHGAQYTHLKNIKKGIERGERHPIGTGVVPFPKKSGRGGKYTWEGPQNDYDYADPVPTALDENDPNYVDEEQEEQDRKVAAGVVEVAKLAPHDVLPVEPVVVTKENQASFQESNPAEK